jgi:hypothetical protein|tara:strand:+ start:1086 stop:1268 length:183 start_codon:yes stop_codon:yes gene_type:complete
MGKGKQKHLEKRLDLLIFGDQKSDHLMMSVSTTYNRSRDYHNRVKMNRPKERCNGYRSYR